MKKRCKVCKETMDEILQWDTVIGYYCDNCGREVKIGTVEGFAGEHYFVSSYNDELNLLAEESDN